MVFGLGGFLPAILPPEKPRNKRLKIILITCFVAFVATASVTFWKSLQHSERLHATTEKMQVLLGHEKTIDQLYEDLFPEDYSTISEALGKLIGMNRVDHRFIECKDPAGLPCKVRLYFAK